MITAIVLTYNEEQHLKRCLASLEGVVERCVVVDSHSTDRTVEIARAMGAEVLQNPFVNQAAQFQWALDTINITSDWTLRIDADEYLEPALRENMIAFVCAPGPVNAVYLRRKIVFLGRAIRYGYFYPKLTLRLWRTGQGRMEQSWMDEHIVVDTPVSKTLDGDLTDHNLNDLAWWTSKHVEYARREVYEMVQRSVIPDSVTQLTGQARHKRLFKDQVYGRLPSGLRAGLYFLYRYILGRGFLDGREGFFFHVLQAFWYRTYVDATLLDMKRVAASRGLSLADHLIADGKIDRPQPARRAETGHPPV